jgi:hypothetical protein
MKHTETLVPIPQNKIYSPGGWGRVGVRWWAVFFKAEEEKCVENVGFTVEGKKPLNLKTSTKNSSHQYHAKEHCSETSAPPL